MSKKKVVKTKKTKASSFHEDIVNTLTEAGEKHGLCLEHTVKETVALLVNVIKQFDGTKEAKRVVSAGLKG